MENNDQETMGKGKNKKVIIICISLALIVCVILGIVAIANSPKRNLQKQMALGDKYLSEMDYEKAVAAYEAAIKIDPKNVDAYIGLAKAYLGLGDEEKAKAALQAALDIQPNIKDKYPDLFAEVTPSEEETPMVGESESQEDKDPSDQSEDGGDKESQETTDDPNDLPEDILSVGTPVVAYGGIIIIQDGEKYGAADYQGKLLVPCEYDGCTHSPTMSGYFALQNGSINGFYADETYIFSPEGKLIRKVENATVHLANEVYTIEEQFPKRGMEYTKYDGTVLCQVENVISASSFNNGNAFFCREDENGDWKYYSVNTEGLVTSVNVMEEYCHSSKHEGYYFMTSAEEGCYIFVADDKKSAIAVRIGSSYLNSEGKAVGRISQDDGYYSYYGIASCRNIEGDGAEWLDVYEGECDLWGYYADGDLVFNCDGKAIVVNRDKYILVNLNETKNKASFPVFDYICLGTEKNWIIRLGDQWGYADHDGNVQHLYQDASLFYQGKALIIEDDTAYLIDENFQKLEEYGKASRVLVNGGLFIIEDENENESYYILDQNSLKKVK